MKRVAKSSAKKKWTKKSAIKKKTPARTTKAKAFLPAFVSLLQSRGLKVPRGLKEAPPEAYADQHADVVRLLSNLSDSELQAQAARIAGYAAKKSARARAAWNTSPLIVELRRRGLKEPPAPNRVLGAAISYRKPLHEWTDKEILEVAGEWSRRAH